ncbi:hypothetical protein HCU01_34730 [Halomonas cupida]|uniref:CYTH domain-containing protein n=1 Tax=Halomonas cupida TaxID=44933 RepID=A0A1M7HCH8_9GAMM|nr:CYTH domain-containing protein [Halomonas cupida]GEN25524.1 hypothetical protein HCU01_34730 [Halomonas cupida]SHM26033.1 CYTH domain-containing protein [Halomonas cupida]
MSQEVEMKLALGQQGPEALRRHPLLAEHPSSRDQLTNTYFDTEAGDLKRARMALRLRRTGKGWVQTLKTSGQGSGGVSQRGEWEWPVTEPTLDLAGLAKLPPISDFPDGLLERLEPRFTTDFHRQTWWLSLDGNHIELALDEGEIRAAGHSVTIRELELELKDGDLTCLPELAERFVDQVALRPSDTSKAARGAALLLGNWPRLQPALPAELLHSINTALDAFSDTGATIWLSDAITALERLGRETPTLSESTTALAAQLSTRRSAMELCQIDRDAWLTPEIGGMLLDLARQLPDHIDIG